MMTDQSMAIDWLSTMKAEALLASHAVIGCTHDVWRAKFIGLHHMHVTMVQEIADLALRRGWYRVPPATHQVLNQLSFYR